MPNPDGTKTDEEKREPWAVQLAREALAPERAPLTRSDVVAYITQLRVTDDSSEAFAAQLVREVKEQWGALEAERKKITTPLFEAKRATDDLFKPALTALEQAERWLKSEIANYMLSKRAANEAALQAAARATTPEQAVMAIAQTQPVLPPAGMSVRAVWRFEVTEPDAVPRELCSPDPNKIQAAIQQKSDKYGQPDFIPGVRIFQDQIVSSRRQ